MPQSDPVPLQTLVDAIPAPVFYKDVEERYLGCNRAFEAATGLDRERITGCTAHDIAPSSLADTYRLKDQELLRQPGVQSYEAQLRYADGSFHDVLFQKATFSDEAATVRGLIGVILDITERKRAEGRLAETLELVHKMVSAAPIGINLYRASDGLCILSNPAMCAIVGLSDDEMLRTCFRKLESWRTHGLLDMAERALASGEDQHLETRIITSGGRSIWASCVFTAFHSGPETHLLLLLEDSTDRVLAEGARARSESRYRTLTEHMGEGLISTDDEGRFTYCNPKFLQMTGYREEEVLGRIFFELTTDYEHDRWRGRIEERRQGRTERYELQLRHHSGQPIEVLVSAAPLLSAEGEFAGTLGIIADIRERKRSEEALRRAHKTESLILLAGGLAHDFNNLFQIIQGNLEMGRDLLGDPDRARRAMERALLSLERASLLSQQMLDYAGKGPSRPVPMDLAELVRRHSAFLSSLTAGGTEIRYAFQGGLPPLEGDPQQLLQVLAALITNSDEALGGRPGVITVEVSAAGAQAEGEWIEPLPGTPGAMLTVTDTGCGMTADILQRLFDPFFTTKELGRGLGLASVLGIIRTHQAGLQVHSRPGRGAIFRIAFPATGHLTAKPEPLPAARPLRLQGYVLLVDDDPGVRVTATQILQEFLGLPVLVARDGEEAVRLYRERADEIAVTLMDATMPNLTGSEAFMAIRAFRPGARAILCSGYSEETGQKLMKEAGFRVFLKKPYSIQDLQRAIGEALAD